MSAKRRATCVAAFIIVRHILMKKKRKPRWWMKDLYRERLQYGNRLMHDINYEEVDNTVRNFTRMSMQDFDCLLEKIEPKITKMNTNFRECITVRERLALTLRFLATGDSYTSLQYLFRISKQSISSIVVEVCNAIIDVLKENVKLPETAEQWLAVAKEFEKKWNFPHAIGALDCKHVCLQSSYNNGRELYDNKKKYSTVLLALVDADYNFMYVNIDCKGQMSDGDIFKNTILYQDLENKTLKLPNPKILQIPYNVDVPYMILCNQAFSEYVMKPFSSDAQKGSIERIFNYRISRACSVVENAFGILSSVFRVLRKPMLLEPERASKVVLATIHLHNYLRKSSTSRNIYTPKNIFDSEEPGQLHANTQQQQQQQIISLLPLQCEDRTSSILPSKIHLHLARHFVTNAPIELQNDY